MIITFVIAVEFNLKYVDWYVYYNNNNNNNIKLITYIKRFYLSRCKNTHINDQWPSRLNKTVMFNPNISCNKIDPAKLGQFNLTITDRCVRIYTCYLLYLLLLYTLEWLNYQQNETPSRRWFNVGPSSTGQHSINIGSMFRVCWLKVWEIIVLFYKCFLYIFAQAWSHCLTITSVSLNSIF